MKSKMPRRVFFLAVFALLVATFPAIAVGAAGPNDGYTLTPETAGGSALIDNGTVQLGVNDEGHLNVFDTGLRYLPTGNDAIYPGCRCEGWGVADAVGGAEGHASVDTGGVNVALVSFTSTATTATSVVEVPDVFRVTHDFRPAVTAYLYEIGVTIENISAAPVDDLRYTRGMDWDVNPTPFDEYVTIQGAAAEPTVLYSDNNGFQFVNPLELRFDMGAVGDFVDFGPMDQGAHFDFGFGPLAAGGTMEFTIFYGAAGNETDALAAIAAVGATVHSLGQPTSSAPDVGEPNTFIFAYRPTIPVDIDIKPGSYPNSVNPGNRGKLPVAILTTGDFDATSVDPSTVTLGDDDGSDTPVAMRKNGTLMASIEDADWDGDMDLILHFETQALVANGDLDAGTTELILNGQTLGGIPIVGSDSVNIVPK